MGAYRGYSPNFLPKKCQGIKMYHCNERRDKACCGVRCVGPESIRIIRPPSIQLNFRYSERPLNSQPCQAVNALVCIPSTEGRATFGDFMHSLSQENLSLFPSPQYPANVGDNTASQLSRNASRNSHMVRLLTDAHRIYLDF